MYCINKAKNYLWYVLIEVYLISVKNLNCKKLIVCDKYTNPPKKINKRENTSVAIVSHEQEFS